MGRGSDLVLGSERPRGIRGVQAFGDRLLVVPSHICLGSLIRQESEVFGRPTVFRLAG